MQDEQLTAVIRKLFAADKPSVIRPIDLLLTIRLLVQHGDENEVQLSQGTLAHDLGCSESAIEHSVDTLENEAKWVDVRMQGHRSMPNRYHVNLDQLPLDADLSRTIVSPWAKQAALNYKNFLKSVNKHRRFPKSTLQRYAFTLEFLKDKKCGGDGNKLAQIIDFAVNHPKFSKAAFRGPERLRRSWRSLEEEFNSRRVK